MEIPVIDGAPAPPAQAFVVSAGNGPIPLTLSETIPSWLTATLSPTSSMSTKVVLAAFCVHPQAVGDCHE